MGENLIPADVQQFIARSIDSVAQLEALLLLRRTPGESWSLPSIARRLYIDERDTEPVLARLVAERLIDSPEGQPPCFRYRPESSQLDEMVARVAEAYTKHLVPVTNLIHAKPRSRVQEFADAFKLRKES